MTKQKNVSHPLALTLLVVSSNGIPVRCITMWILNVCHYLFFLSHFYKENCFVLQAQNIKNFKSQRWQMLLNFSSQRRLLLTGTPLQNSLMELWSLMHFLMPHVFQSHKEFKEWFSNPLTGMVEGSQDYNDGLVRRLHKVSVLAEVLYINSSI